MGFLGHREGDPHILDVIRGAGDNDRTASIDWMETTAKGKTGTSTAAPRVRSGPVRNYGNFRARLLECQHCSVLDTLVTSAVVEAVWCGVLFKYPNCRSE